MIRFPNAKKRPSFAMNGIFCVQLTPIGQQVVHHAMKISTHFAKPNSHSVPSFFIFFAFFSSKPPSLKFHRPSSKFNKSDTGMETSRRAAPKWRITRLRHCLLHHAFITCHASQRHDTCNDCSKTQVYNRCFFTEL